MTKRKRKPRNRSLTYRTWDIMIQRCTNPKCTTYHKYGGRGITVCDRWRSFANFLADMGERPTKTHTIDRFPNQSGNYEPGNCRWATKQQQSRNLKSNKMLTHEGETLCLAEWCARKGLGHVTIIWRLGKGWSVAEALDTPAGSKRK